MATQALLGAFALAFAVKVPPSPFHSWLPDAHVQAPTRGVGHPGGVPSRRRPRPSGASARRSFPMAAVAAAPAFLPLAVGIWYGPWVAFAQTDMKKLGPIPRSATWASSSWASSASTSRNYCRRRPLQMVNHGLSTGRSSCWWACCERAHSRQIADFGGLW
ncbi:MAG: hypothetical protein IPL60_09625 [Ardenticatenia bacterium]|nr:hypothetical protein [Ardenticatenia bacterium]